MLSFESSLLHTVDDGDDDEDDDLSGFLLGLATSRVILDGSWVLDFHRWWYSPSRQCPTCLVETWHNAADCLSLAPALHWATVASSGPVHGQRRMPPLYGPTTGALVCSMWRSTVLELYHFRSTRRSKSLEFPIAWCMTESSGHRCVLSWFVVHNQCVFQRIWWYPQAHSNFHLTDCYSRWHHIHLDVADNPHVMTFRRSLGSHDLL